MGSYFVRRVVWAGVLLLVVTFVTYIIFFVIPSDRGRNTRRTEFNTADIRRAVNVDGPVWQQYGEFLWNLGHGSLGRSFRTREDVTSIIEKGAPITVVLVAGGALIWLCLAIPIGIFSALRPRSLLDRSGTIFVLLGISAHPVWIGLMFSYFLGYRLHWTPVEGYCHLVSPPPGATCGGPREWFSHMLLPWITFALLFAAIYTRMIRASVSETLEDDHVRTARAKGAPENRVVRSHVLRTALLPIVTMLGMDLGHCLAAAVFVEKVYGLPGLGGSLVDALPSRDLPTILGVTVFFTVAIVVLNLFVDLIYAIVDPRVRMGKALS